MLADFFSCDILNQLSKIIMTIILIIILIIRDMRLISALFPICLN